MSDKTTFLDYWTAMSPDPKYNIRREDAERAWDAHPEKHAPIMRWLRKRGAYPQRNPYYFILDFQSCDASYLPEPTNYQGRALPAGKIIVSARYREKWGFYELEEAETHGMEIRYPEHIFTTDREIVEKINNHVDWVQVSVPYMTEDFIFCSRKNAEKYHLRILADPRNPDNIRDNGRRRNKLARPKRTGAFNLPQSLLSPRSITTLALRGDPR